MLLSKDNRSGKIDIIKAIAMIMVVLGHCGPSAVYFSLYYVHLPLFLLCTGYLLYDGKWESQGLYKSILKRFSGLMYPYLSFGILTLIYLYLTRFIRNPGFDRGELFSSWILNMLALENNTNWFLPALFISVCLFMILRKLRIINLYSFIPLVAVCILISEGVKALAPSRDIHYVIWYGFTVFARVFVFLVFLMIGFYLHPLCRRINETRLTVWIITTGSVIGIVLFFCLTVHGPMADLHYADWENAFTYYAFSVLGATSIFILINSIHAGVPKLLKPVYSTLIYIGRNTLIINGTHTSIGIVTLSGYIVARAIPGVGESLFAFMIATVTLLIECLIIIPAFNKVLPFLIRLPRKPLDNISISITKCRIAAYIYLTVPVILFNVGWLRAQVAVPSSIILAIGLLALCRTLYLNDGDKSVIRLSPRGLFVILAILAVWLISSGIGGLVWQRPDWHARNAVLHDLLDNRWPVIYENGEGLVYYLVFWMVPATAGKLFGVFADSAASWGIANIVLFLWCFIGLLILAFLLYGYVADKQDGDAGSSAFLLKDSKAVFILLFMIMWGGLNLIGQSMTAIMGYRGMSLDSTYGWSKYQYTPNIALLEWVFNQGLPAMLGAFLYLHARRDHKLEEYVLLVMLLIPCSPYAAVGLVLLMLTDIVMSRCRGLFSLPNICALIAVLPVFGAYYGSNMTGADSLGRVVLSQPVGEFGLDDVFAIIVCCVLQFGIYAVLLWKDCHRDPLFITSICVLTLIPFITIGPGRNFIMRGSIIPMLVMMVYVLNAVMSDEYRSGGTGLKLCGYNLTFLILCVCIVIAAYPAVCDLILTVIRTADPSVSNIADDIGSMAVKDVAWWNEYMTDANYLSDNVQTAFFYKYMARHF